MTEIEGRIELAIDAKFNWLKPLICLTQFTVFLISFFLFSQDAVTKTIHFLSSHFCTFENIVIRRRKGKKFQQIIEFLLLNIISGANLVWIIIFNRGYLSCSIVVFCTFVCFFFNARFLLIFFIEKSINLLICTLLLKFKIWIISYIIIYFNVRKKLLAC